jgi:lipoprotein-anchoring transpeptidase ErfK/SrfK
LQFSADYSSIASIPDESPAMRRPLAFSFIAFCLILTASVSASTAARAGIIDDIRAEQALGGKHGRLNQRQLQRLERQQQLKEIEQQKREERQARREERLKAIAEARAAKEAERAEKLAAFKEAKAAKAAELAEKKAALEAAKEEARLAKEAESAAKNAKEQTASIFDATAAPEQIEAAPVDPQVAQREEWDENLGAWIDTDEGTRPPPRQEVTIETREAPGTIIIDTTQRRLYYVLGDNRAIQYGIGVGRPGFEWMGVKSVTRKEEWPDWRPPEEMIMRRPDLPRYMPGGPTNPLGARAMYLGSSLYRIHGSNEPETIGQAVSSGCFRMVNADVIDLYNRTQVGAKVIVR